VTHEFFLADMNEFCWEQEKRPGVIDCSVFHGFPWADISITGTTVIVTTEGDDALAKEVQPVALFSHNTSAHLPHNTLAYITPYCAVRSCRFRLHERWVLGSGRISSASLILLRVL
jgi:microcystin degradation protein MlrC